MACRDALENQNQVVNMAGGVEEPLDIKSEDIVIPERLLFGVDSKTPAYERLQNNLTLFEWVIRNKTYPNFWVRNITGENALTKEEVELIHSQGCKVAAVYSSSDEKGTEEQGRVAAKNVCIAALKLGIPSNAVVFLEIKDGETVTTDYMRGFASALLVEDFIPGFKANTDSKYDFDSEFSRGLQTDAEVFSRCKVWALAPNLEEYDRITTTHLIHPDNWVPYAPSGITRKDIAIWQYGKGCHPIQTDAGEDTYFNLNLVRDERVITKNMF